ncbi:uncharacterized protein NECHADRAFT_80115 [Fusarium vanettenii 77-13-4]|uniref:Uncharacterized protein n=1 Tax=Fusarium vanettenii (strain ATCC MYA-4622 / CBS 123669 / FGSC 9596 / NRRL 45880 / 77-13-4) TaxID=660122 RepID=C7Z150_FUSV7|nr:uncharacterized protein NECHADRAFT_80115 [Fusarium vanettenii 77-13-4]EEU42508.1 predicted protein [Fusarium vanettenii 77-13-4]
MASEYQDAVALRTLTQANLRIIFPNIPVMEFFVYWNDKTIRAVVVDMTRLYWSELGGYRPSSLIHLEWKARADDPQGKLLEGHKVLFEETQTLLKHRLLDRLRVCRLNTTS